MGNENAWTIRKDRREEKREKERREETRKNEKAENIGH